MYCRERGNALEHSAALRVTVVGMQHAAVLLPDYVSAVQQARRAPPPVHYMGRFRESNHPSWVPMKCVG